MAVPVLLVTGFLGAGKTTLINHLLTEPQGRRLAAVVNDFGAIDIDAALLGSVADGVVSLKNGCICCSLQGDLLRTLAALLRREPPPEGIVIETSGVSDPAEIVRSLLDPVIWREAALEVVVCVADASRPDLLDDPLCQSQLRAADFIALNKTGQVDAAALDRLRTALTAFKPARVVQDTPDGRMPPELLFSGGLHQPAAAPARLAVAAPDFQTVSWTSGAPLSLPRFQSVIGRMAGRLLRAKGILHFAEHPGRTMVFQLVGERATVVPAPSTPVVEDLVRLVFIARPGAIDADELRAALEGTVAG